MRLGDRLGGLSKVSATLLIATIFVGLVDLAKHCFQVHAVDANGHVVVRRRLWRSGVIPYFRALEPSCLRRSSNTIASSRLREAGKPNSS
jgi:hypothetical protein